MNKHLVAPVSAALLMAVAGAAQAATRTDGFTVSATVAGNCLITAQDMNFGTFDLLDTTDQRTTSDILVRCTNGTSYGVSLSAGSGSYANRTLLNAASETLVYNLYTDASLSAVWGDDSGTTDIVSDVGEGMGIANLITHKVHGQILGSANLGAKPGTYTSNITATITY
jgi:spore coat protein U-like protein